MLLLLLLLLAAVCAALDVIIEQRLCNLTICIVQLLECTQYCNRFIHDNASIAAFAIKQQANIQCL
jgi:hypothetical protein